MDTDKTGQWPNNIKPPCEDTLSHKWVWESAADGKQEWICVQCGHTIYELEDSQP